MGKPAKNFEGIPTKCIWKYCEATDCGLECEGPWAGDLIVKILLDGNWEQ